MNVLDIVEETCRDKAYSKDNMLCKEPFEYFMNHWLGRQHDLYFVFNGHLVAVHGSEAELYKDAPEAVLAYWKSRGAGPLTQRSGFI